jgi:Arc/MetJ-type ribon-helix-helix transcriptional regulator
MEIAIKRGWAPNRSQLIKAALERDLRRMAAEHDRARLAEVGAADDLDELVSWSAAHFKMED